MQGIGAAMQKTEGPYAAFDRLKQSTFCPFAKAAVLEYAPWSQRDTDLEAFNRAVVDGLSKHLGYARERGLGGYVARLPASGRTFESDVSDFARFVQAIGTMDTSTRESLRQDVSAEGWSLHVAGEPVFLNFFSSRYPTTHSKYIGCPDSFWVFFQPEFIFSQNGINRNERITKLLIRAKFAEAGMAYEATEIDRRRKALCYVFPRYPSDEPIEWWRR
jgi:hypothetical protein